MSDQTFCRLLQKKDYPQIVELMEKLRIPIFDLYSKAIYRSFSRQALKDEKIVFAVVERNNKLVGLVIALIDRNRFLVSFLSKQCHAFE